VTYGRRHLTVTTMGLSASASGQHLSGAQCAHPNAAPPTPIHPKIPSNRPPLEIRRPPRPRTPNSAAHPCRRPHFTPSKTDYINDNTQVPTLTQAHLHLGSSAPTPRNPESTPASSPLPSPRPLFLSLGSPCQAGTGCAPRRSGTRRRSSSPTARRRAGSARPTAASPRGAAPAAPPLGWRGWVGAGAGRRRGGGSEGGGEGM
jgi:hypothetical protein